METLRNIEETKLYIRLEIIDNPVTTISAKESKCAIDKHIERETPQQKVVAKYSLIFIEI